MSTRLLSESIVRERYPHLRYVRIHTSGSRTATIYAWDDRLELSEADRESLRKFAAAYLTPFVCFKVEPYGRIREEGIPAAPEVPACVSEAAMNRRLTLRGIAEVVDGMLAGGSMCFERYDPAAATAHMAISSERPISLVERELLELYLGELMPLGTRCEVRYTT